MPQQNARQPVPASELPSPATLFHLRLYDQTSADLISGAKQQLQPLLKLRDWSKLQRIQAAHTPEELLDLSPQATGLAQEAWHRRMRAFGPAALPPIQDTLRQLRFLEDSEARYRISALLISELRWHGVDGAQALLSCLDEMDNAAACLACVALGLSRQPALCEPVWRCYLRMKARPDDLDFIGGLWALIDLHDRRVAGELLEYLQQKRYFFELFGFLSLAGDEQALPLLVAGAMEQDQKQGVDALMAATGIAHRVGKPALVRQLLEIPQADLGRPEAGSQTQADEIAADEIAADEIGTMILARPLMEVEEYFALFYRGFSPQDATAALKAIRQNTG